MPDAGHEVEHYDDLYELLLKFTDDNIKEVIHWTIHHKIRKPIVAENNVIPEDLSFYLYHLQKMVGELGSEYGTSTTQKRLWSLKRRSFVGELGSEYGTSTTRLDDYYQKMIRQRLNNADRNIFDRSMALDTTEQLNNNIKMLLARKKGRIGNTVDTYEEEKATYLQDTQILISDIIDILRLEYETRIRETKNAIVKYVEPHKIALSKLNSDVSSVDKALENLKTETLLSENDKKGIKIALLEKKTEMLQIKHREEDNIKNTKAFVEEIKKAQQRFNEMIQMLDRKNLEATTRKGYLALIDKLGARIPALDDLFNDLSSEFRKDIANIKDAFYLLNMSIKDDLIKSLENQQRISEILGLSGESVMDRIHQSKETMDRNTTDDTVYDIDLAFLDLK